MHALGLEAWHEAFLVAVQQRFRGCEALPQEIRLLGGEPFGEPRAPVQRDRVLGGACGRDPLGDGGPQLRALAEADEQRRLGQEYRLQQFALLRHAGPQCGQRPVIGDRVAGQRRAQGGLGTVLLAVARAPPAPEDLLGRWLQVRGERIVLPQRERREAAVHGATQPGAVVAAPVQDGRDVDHAVAGTQMGLHGPRKRAAVILQQQPVLLVGVHADVRARHDPQHVVVVERDVPLDVGGAVLDDVVDVAAQGCGVDRVNVAVPVGGAAVAHRAAHHHQLGGAGVLDAEQPVGHRAQPVAGPHLDRRRAATVDLRAELPRELQARLRGGLPPAAGRIVGPTFVGPHRPLALHQDLVGAAHLRKPCRLDYLRHDQVSLAEKPLAIDVRGETVTRGSVSCSHGSAPPRPVSGRHVRVGFHQPEAAIVLVTNHRCNCSRSWSRTSRWAASDHRSSTSSGSASRSKSCPSPVPRYSTSL